MSELGNISFLSIGEACQTSYQIRRFTKCDDAFFYDWIATTSDSFKGILTDENCFLQSGNWEIVDGGDRLLDKQNKIRYRHEFPVLEHNKNHVNPLLVESHITLARNKFLYLREKTIEKIKRTKKLCLVCYMENANNAEIKLKAKNIFTFFMPLNSEIRLVIASDIEIDEKIDGRLYQIRINKGSDWMGDNKSWDKLFSTVLADWV